MASSFQYSSTLYSPSTETINSFNKSVIGAINETKEQSNKYNSYSNIPTADYLPPNTWSTGYALNENKNLVNQNSNFTTNTIKLPKRSQQIDMSNIIRNAELKKAYGGRVKLCTFCKTNGETELVYSSHSLKDVSDKITCPILLNYASPECGAAGQPTHTKKYCPVLQKRLRMEMLQKLSSSNKEN